MKPGDFPSSGPLLSDDFFDFARQAVRRTEMSARRRWGRHALADEATGDAYNEHAMEAVVWSVMAAEAGINELAHFVARNELPADFGDQRLLDKWSTIARHLAGHDFDKGRAPWQDFVALVKLRNAYVHFTWEPTDKQGLMAGLLQRKLIFPGVRKQGWHVASANTRVGRWAVNTVSAMFAELDRIIVVKPGFWPIQLGRFRPLGPRRARLKR